MREAVAERWVKHPASKVWRALSEPELAASWLPFEGYRAEVGARFTARGPTGTARCEVVQLQAPRLVVCSWEEGGETSEVRIELVDDVGGTRVVVRHTAGDEARRSKLHGLWTLLLQAPLDQVLGLGATAAATTAGLGALGTGLAVVGLVVALGVGAALGTSSGSGRRDGPGGPAEAGVEDVVVASVAPAVEPEAPEAHALPPHDTEAYPNLPPIGRGDAVTVYDDLPTTLHPLFPSRGADVRVQRLVWEPLFERSPITGEVRSRVVAEQEWVGSALRVTLHEGLRFHDGQPITADDVCFSVRTVLDPKLPTTLPFRERADLTGCTVKGPRVAELAFRARLPDGPIRAAVPVLPAHAFDPSPESEVATRPVGSGPYRGHRGRRQVRLEATRVDAGVPRIDIAEGSPLVAERTLALGGVQGVIEVHPPLWEEVARNDQLQLRSWDPQVLFFLATNPTTLGDASLRGRIADAIDRNALLELVYGRDRLLGPEPITGPFLPSSAFYNRSVKATVPGAYVPVDRAPLRLGYDPEATWAGKHVAQEVHNQLRRAGVPVEMVKASAPDPAAHDLWLGTWQVDPTHDPTGVLKVGPLGARSDRVDAQLRAMREARSDTEQQDAAHTLHEVVFAEKRWIGLFAEVRTSAWRAGLEATISPYDYWADVESWRIGPDRSASR